MAFQSIGPAVLLLGDPTQINGAGYVNLGNVESVDFDAGIRHTYTSTARENGTPLASGIYTLAPSPTVGISLTDADVDKMNALILGSTLATGALKPGDEFAAVAEADVPTLSIIPVSQIASGIAAPNGIHLPAVMASGLSGLSFGRTQEGETSNPYSVTFTGAKRYTDQAATAIPSGARIWFMGDPADLSLTWSAPASL